MPVITDITKQKKRENRYSIFVDGTYVFSLEELELSGSGLRVGQELSSQEIEDWQQRSESGKAYNAALRYLGYRQRSEMELRRYLKDKDYEAVADETIERLLELGLVDDLALARTWIGDRLRLKPRSRRGLSAELRQKGIAADVIEVALAELEPQDELEALRGLIQKKRHRYASDDKLIAYLMTQGYSYGLIKEAIESDAN